MTSWYKELLKILAEEKRLLTELHEIVSEERDAIVGLKAEELERILRKKESTLVKLSMWESERERLLKRNGHEGKSMKAIIEFLKSTAEREIVAEAEELFDKMKTILSSIEDIQRINQQLIDHSLIQIGAAIKFLENFGITAKSTLSREA